MDIRALEQRFSDGLDEFWAGFSWREDVEYNETIGIHLNVALQKFRDQYVNDIKEGKLPTREQAQREYNEYISKSADQTKQQEIDTLKKRLQELGSL